jgi:hypothetical protein
MGTRTTTLTLLIWLQGLWTKTNTLFKEENGVFVSAGSDGDMKRIHILVVELKHGISEHLQSLVLVSH